MADSVASHPSTAPSPPTRGLPPEAYEKIPGEMYQPYVPEEASIPELTVKAVVVGIVLGIVFGAANAYLGLRVGLTVSASIPAAVMAIAIFRVLRSGTILETNIVQTVGSAGESLAAGVIFTLPALYIWGIDAQWYVLATVSFLGAVLGVLFMIPLRRFLMSSEHGVLPFPEGTATAEVQVAGETGGSKAKLVFGGLGIGALYQALVHGSGVALWPGSPEANVFGDNPSPGLRKTVIAGDLTPELLGVGFIIGPRISGIMVAGGITAWFGLIPLIDLFGAGLQAPVPPEPEQLIGGMDAGTIWNSYVRYIGAGAVAGGGIITLIRALPLMWGSLSVGLRRIGPSAARVLRTDRDVPLRGVLLASLAVALLLWSIPFIEVSFIGALLMVVFAFFFVTVSARIVGLIGSSSNPVSGMTIAALLVTSLIFLALGRADPSAPVAVLLVGAVVCIAASIAGDTSQDLKCGFLIGATPWKQQVAELIGIPFAAVSMAFVLQLLHTSYGIGSPDLAAPQATLMATVIDGVLTQSLPWALVFVGVAIAVVVELLGVPSLPYAVGLYLPLSLTTSIFAGGVVRWIIEKRNRGESLQEKREAGVLYASGLIAGAALLGVLIAVPVAFAPGVLAAVNIGSEWAGSLAPALSLAAFTALAVSLYLVATRAESDAVTHDPTAGVRREQM
ncbi:MAG: oligopeptide transporter, OPT family [Gemmatimonas sp.]|nr:oligopeptide transporter, OPT family [Gemmatimonas sp.]